MKSTFDRLGPVSLIPKYGCRLEGAKVRSVHLEQLAPFYIWVTYEDGSSERFCQVPSSIANPDLENLAGTSREQARELAYKHFNPAL